MKDDDSSGEDVIVHANEMGQLRVDDDAVRTGAATQATDWQIGILNQTSKLKLSKQQTEKGWGWDESSAANSSADKANNMAALRTTPQQCGQS